MFCSICFSWFPAFSANLKRGVIFRRHIFLFFGRTHPHKDEKKFSFEKWAHKLPANYSCSHAPDTRSKIQQCVEMSRVGRVFTLNSKALSFLYIILLVVSQRCNGFTSLVYGECTPCRLLSCFCSRSSIALDGT